MPSRQYTGQMWPARPWEGQINLRTCTTLQKAAEWNRLFFLHKTVHKSCYDSFSNFHTCRILRERSWVYDWSLTCKTREKQWTHTCGGGVEVCVCVCMGGVVMMPESRDSSMYFLMDSLLGTERLYRWLAGKDGPGRRSTERSYRWWGCSNNALYLLKTGARSWWPKGTLVTSTSSLGGSHFERLEMTQRKQCFKHLSLHPSTRLSSQFMLSLNVS